MATSDGESSHGGPGLDRGRLPAVSGDSPMNSTTTYLPDGLYEVSTVGGCSGDDGDGAAEGERLKEQQLEMLRARRAVHVRRAQRIALQRLLAVGEVTADHIYGEIDLPPGIDPRCLGAAPQALAKAGIIASAGWITSTRPQRHASPVIRWILIDRPAAERWLAEHAELPDVLAPGERPAAIVQMELTFNEVGDPATAAQSSRTL